MKRFKIADRWIGGKSPAFIVAELSCNHRGSLSLAKELIEMAAMVDADAVKLQTDNPEGGITINCNKSHFKVHDDWDNKYKSLYELYRETYTPWEWTDELIETARKHGVILFSTPSCIPGVKFLSDRDMPCYKISSFEITDIPLIEAVAATKKPVILSDGCADKTDLDLAIKTLRDAGNDRIAVLNCVSQYPAYGKHFNLTEIGKYEDVVPGISDHTFRNDITFAAVALGAKIVERHFTLTVRNGGPDEAFSLEPPQFREMVEGVREIEAAISDGHAEKSHKYCKSIFVVQDIPKGECLAGENIGIIRPGHGIHPKEWKAVIGKIATKDLERGEPLKDGDYE